MNEQLKHTKHTPGPCWHISKTNWDKMRLNGSIPTVQMDGAWAVIVSLGASKDEVEATVRLIVAAPDLLSACKVVRLADVSAAARDLIRAAIDKAEVVA